MDNVMVRRGLMLGLMVAASVFGAAVPASATEFGEMVDYDMVFPVQGEHHFTDTFWASRSHGLHSAQDVMADKGTPVVAIADGTVRLVNWSARADLDPSRCCSIVIDHADGWQSTYIHLDNDSPGTDDGAGWGIADGVAPGVGVEAGQLIGWVGDSGNAEDTPPHLHLELRDPSGTLVNAYESLLAADGGPPGDGAADPLFDGARALRQGDEGADVVRLQEVLNTIGFDVGRADGDFGPATNRGVVAFQEAQALDPDGIVGRLTKSALAVELEAHAPPPALPTEVLRQGSRGEAVEVLQRELSAVGFDPGIADGIFGPNTHGAVVAFQTDRSLVVDGIVGPQTWGALRPQ